MTGTRSSDLFESAAGDGLHLWLRRETGPSGADRLRLHLLGEIDYEGRADLDEALAAVARAGTDVVVDLTGATFLDSHGLGFLVQLRTQLTRSGQTVTLHQPTGMVLRALRVMGFDRHFPITHEPDPQAGRATLPAGPRP